MTEHGARAECDFTPMVDRIAEQVQWRVDHAALEKAAGALEEHGYVKVVRCRDCRFYKTGDSGKWCLKSITTISDPDGFCAWAERRES